MKSKKANENQNDDCIVIPDEKLAELGQLIMSLVIGLIMESAEGVETEGKRGRGRPKKNGNVEEKLDRSAKKDKSVRVRG